MAADPRSDRKAKLRAWKDARRAAREAGMPLSHDDLRARFEHLDEALHGRCDHTLRLTRQFVLSRGLDEARVVDCLGEYGGYCDCEVLADVQSDGDDGEDLYAL